MTQEYDDHGERAHFEKEEKERYEAAKDMAEADRKREMLSQLAQERARRNRFQLGASIAVIAMGFLVLIIQGDLVDVLYPYRINRVVFLGVGISLFAIGAASLMLQYLRGALSVNSLEPHSSSSVGGGLSVDYPRGSNIEQLFAQLQKEVSNLRTEFKLSSPHERDASRLNTETLVTDLAAQLESRFIESASQASHINQIRSTFTESRARLANELISLGFRGNLNLVIGVLTTGLAVGLLAYMVLGSIQIFDSLPSLLSYYVPRISVVLFIEVFSFFFLRLYRATLSETRAYQADLTSISLKQVAVEAAWANSDVAVRTSLSKELIASASPVTQSSSNTEKSAVDPKILSELLEKFGEVILKKEKKDG